MPDALDLNIAEYNSTALHRTQQVAWCCSTVNATGLAAEQPTVLFLHGMRSDFTGWWNNTRFQKIASQNPGLYVFVNSEAQGWYTNAPGGGSQCEQDIVEDVVQWVTANLPAAPSRDKWAIAGQSMGGYGALKLALKFPHLFGNAVSFSGALDITRTADAQTIFGDRVENRAFRRANDLFYLAEEALCRFPLERPYLSFNCGTEDPFLEASRAFHQHLQFIGYGHSYWEDKGHHTWPYWNRALRRAIPELMAHMATPSGG